MRKSQVTTHQDQAGSYEVETFDCPNPKAVVVCSHGNGVRRWDGEHFFHNVAEHYADRVFLLVDQNQPYEDGCKLPSITVMVSRVQKLVDAAAASYPGVPIIVLGHSMGCAIAARLDLDAVQKVIFVAPAAGDAISKLAERYGPDVLQGKLVKTTDGLTKYITKEYVESVQGAVWEQDYEKLLRHYKPVHVFESGDEEIVGEERLALRTMPFASYQIVPGAKHDVAGEALQELFGGLGALL